MYNSSLTIESALEEVGDITGLFSWQLDRCSDFVQAYRRYRVLLREAFKRGWLRDDRLKGKASVSEQKTFPEAKKEACEKAGDCYEEIFHFGPQGLGTFLSYPEWDSVIDDFLLTTGLSCVAEVLLNAVEHGTQWCRKGLVDVRAVRGSTGALVVVDQSTAGLDDTEVQRFLQATQPKHLLRETDGKEARGHGLASVKDHLSPDVRFFRLDEGGFRSLVLLTLDMAAERTPDDIQVVIGDIDI